MKTPFLENYDTIIWDWNGTLLNDVDLCVNISKKVLSPYLEEELTLEKYQEVFGFPIISYYQKLGVDLEKVSFEELTNIFIPLYAEGMTNCELQEGALEALETFSNNNKQQFILTAAKTDSMLPLVTQHKLDHFFEAIYGLDNYEAASKVERGLELIKEERINVNRTLMFGDTIHDFEVAQAMGVDCILVGRGHQSAARLKAATKGKAKVLESLVSLFN